MRWRLAVAIVVLNVLLGGLAASALPQGAAPAQALQPVVAVYDLPNVVGVVEVTSGVGEDAVWVVEAVPVGLARVAGDAPPTGGVLPVRVVTETLEAVTHTLTITGLPPSPVVTVPVTAITMPADLIYPSPGIAEYAWPTDTHSARRPNWLARPVPGTLHGTPGLWTQRTGALDFLDPAAGIITAYESDAFGALPVRLSADIPGLIWGVAEGRIFALHSHAEPPMAEVFLGSDHPADVSHAFHDGGTSALWFSDWARRAVIMFAYPSYYWPGQGTRTAYQLPGMRTMSEVVYVETDAALRRVRWPGGLETWSVGWELWYLDRVNQRLGRFIPRPYPSCIVEYDLPAPAGLSLGDLAYDGERLWFAMVGPDGGEIASFDPGRALLTRYQSSALPVIPHGGASRWAAEGSQVYQLLDRCLLYLPLVQAEGS